MDNDITNYKAQAATAAEMKTTARGNADYYIAQETKHDEEEKEAKLKRIAVEKEKAAYLQETGQEATKRPMTHLFSQQQLDYYQAIPEARQYLDGLQNLAPRIIPPALANTGADLDDLDEFEIEVDEEVMANMFEQRLDQATMETHAQHELDPNLNFDDTLKANYKKGGG